MQTKSVTPLLTTVTKGGIPKALVPDTHTKLGSTDFAVMFAKLGEQANNEETLPNLAPVKEMEPDSEEHLDVSIAASDPDVNFGSEQSGEIAQISTPIKTNTPGAPQELRSVVEIGVEPTEIEQQKQPRDGSAHPIEALTSIGSDMPGRAFTDPVRTSEITIQRVETFELQSSPVKQAVEKQAALANFVAVSSSVTQNRTDHELTGQAAPEKLRFAPEKPPAQSASSADSGVPVQQMTEIGHMIGAETQTAPIQKSTTTPPSETLPTTVPERLPQTPTSVASIETTRQQVGPGQAATLENHMVSLEKASAQQPGISLISPTVANQRVNVSDQALGFIQQTSSVMHPYAENAVKLSQNPTDAVPSTGQPVSVRPASTGLTANVALNGHGHAPAEGPVDNRSLEAVLENQVAPVRSAVTATAGHPANTFPTLRPGGETVRNKTSSSEVKFVSDPGLTELDLSHTSRDGSSAIQTRSDTALLQTSVLTVDQSQMRSDAVRSAAANAVEVLVRQPGKPVEISLNPEELGRVRIALSTSDAGVTVTITSERPETLDLMRRHIDQLALEFGQMGYESASFEFKEDSLGKDDTSDEVNSGEMAETKADSKTAPVYRLVSTGLDVRL